MPLLAATPDADPRTSGPRTPLVALASGGVTVALALPLARWLGFGPIDDAFISLRYAANWATGNGLAFNPGELVEGYTNFLLVALEALAIELGAEPVTAMVVLGWLALAAVAALTYALLAIHVLPGRPWVAALLAIAATLNPALVGWAASGLETCLFTAALLASLLAALSAQRRMRVIGAAAGLTAAALTRPEAIAFMPIVAGAVFLAGRRSGEALRFALSFAVLYGIYFVARWLHFGHPLPNTFYAKLDYGNAWLLGRGALYVWQFAAATPLLVLLAVVAATRVRRARRWLGSSLAFIAAGLAIAIYEGGDHFALFRFLVPILPLLAAAALDPIVCAAERWLPAQARALGIAVAGLMTLAASAWWIGQPLQQDGLGLRQLDRMAFESRLAAEWSMIGRWLRTAAAPDRSVAIIAVGAVGFHSGLRVIDPHGIVDSEIAHLDIELGRGYAGHEKYDTARLLSHRPSYVILQNRLTRRPIPLPALGSGLWGDFNKQLYACPELAREYDYRVFELAPGRFLNMHVRKDL